MRGFLAGLAMACAPMGAMQADAAELLMFDTDGCFWCQMWKDDVGGYYHKTREGRTAPLRIVDLDAPMPPDLRWLRGVRASPTFVLIDDGREIGRIVGYPGEDRFWMLMAIEMRKLAGQRF